jgi:hypothetical protein
MCAKCRGISKFMLDSNYMESPKYVGSLLLTIQQQYCSSLLGKFPNFKFPYKKFQV